MALLEDCEYLSEEDLEAVIGSEMVDKLFQDSGSGVRDAAKMGFHGLRAESDAAAKLLRGWSKAQIVTLMENDVGLRSHVAWMCLHYGSERKEAFHSDEGEGAFPKQYKRALDHFDALSKAKAQSVGEAAAGENAQTRGAVLPQLPTGTQRFVFAPTKTRPRGGGLF